MKPLSLEEQKRRRPLPVEILIDARDDTVHKEIGVGRAARISKRRIAACATPAHERHRAPPED